MRVFTLLLLIILCYSPCHAQYVTIPDTAFRSFLKDAYPACFNGNDEMDTTCSEVLATTKLGTLLFNIQNITGIEFFKNLEELDLINASVTRLPLLPNKIRYLEVSWVTDSIFSLPDSLHTIGITSMLSYIDYLPPHLKKFLCLGSRLESLPPLPAELEDFTILSEYTLKTLPDLPNSLKVLHIAYANEDFILNLAQLPQELEYLHLVYTQVYQLPPLPSKLRAIYMDACWPINCLPPLPDSLDMLNVSGTQITCIPNAPNGNTFGMPLCFGVSMCEYNATASGTVFRDINFNNIFDQGIDQTLPGCVITNSTNSYISVTDDNGNYTIAIDTAKSNIIKVTGPTNISNATPDSIVITNPNYGDFLANNNFAVHFAPIQGQSVVISNGPARPGFQQWAVATVTNVGGLPVSNATLKIIKPAGFSYVSSTPAATVSGDTLTWSNISLNLLQHLDFQMVTQIPATTPIGTSYSIVATVTPTDTTPANNIFISSGTVTGSYDPNDKNVSDTAITITNLDNYLTYTVRFQNTGNDTAFNVLISDTLSPLLDATTLRLVTSSHPCQFTVYEKGWMQFFFPNILLPDTFTNEPASHGFVTYQVKPKTTLALGETIRNTAYIYFDFNEPIVTNTTQTTHVQVVNIDKTNRLTWQLYPNPAKNAVTIETGNQSGIVQLTDVCGKEIFHQPITGKSTIALNGLSAGVYLIKLQLGSQSDAAKLIVE